MILFQFVACALLEGDPTPVPVPVPAVPSEPATPEGPDLSTNEGFHDAFVDAACDAGIRCGSEAVLDAYDCPDGDIHVTPCTDYDAQAAAVCLAEEWTCETIAGEAFALPPLACNVVCANDPVTPEPTPPPTPVDPSFDVSFGFGGVDIVVYDALSTDTFRFGLAQTTLDTDIGWYGEDCDGDQTSGFDICHSLGATGGSLALGGITTVSDGTTLIDDTYQESEFTFVLIRDSDDACWTDGHATSYYPGCALLP